MSHFMEKFRSNKSLVSFVALLLTRTLRSLKLTQRRTAWR